MGKLLFWVVVILVVWLAWSLWRIAQRRQERAQEANGPGRHANDARAAGGRMRAGREPERMIACAHCGVFLPYSESVHGRGIDGGDYCCVEHRDAARR